MEKKKASILNPTPPLPLAERGLGGEASPRSTDKWFRMQISVVFGFDNDVIYGNYDDVHVMIGER